MVRRHRRALRRVTPWVLAAAGVLFVPLAAWNLLIAAWGTPGGFVYFGHEPEYVFPGDHYAGRNYYVREVGGGWRYDVPVGEVAALGIGVLVSLPMLALGMLLREDAARLRVRLGGERRWLRRLGNGVCPDCGYDIRAARGVCPECGSRLTLKGTAYQRFVERMCRRWEMPHADLLLRHLMRLVL